jgi:hypothetical protein
MNRLSRLWFRVLCRLGWHSWLLNHRQIRVGTVRTCRRCDRREKCFIHYDGRRSGWWFHLEDTEP